MKSEQILINEYNALMNLRERSIKSIGSTANSYTTFLGLLATAVSIIYKYFENKDDSLIFLPIGLAFVVYGVIIYSSIISSHINFTIYTRKLNLTRRLLVMNKKGLRKKIFLPIDGNEPNFDELGFLKQKYSKVGFLAIIKWINSVLLGFLIAFGMNALFNLTNNLKKQANFVLLLVLSIFFFCISLFFHNCYHRKKICEGERMWIEEKKPKF